MINRVKNKKIHQEDFFIDIFLVFAYDANAMADKAKTLGSEIRRLRTDAGETLRGFATRAGISAPHLSDIEHDRRRPSEETLSSICALLKGVGAKYEALTRLSTGLDPDTQAWVSRTPGIRSLLRRIQDDGTSPEDLLREIEQKKLAGPSKRKPDANDKV